MTCRTCQHLKSRDVLSPLLNLCALREGHNYAIRLHDNCGKHTPTSKEQQSARERYFKKHKV